MTGTLATTGNIAVFEYPELADPEFHLGDDGALFVHGYSMDFVGGHIGYSSRFDLKLKGYKVIGKLDKAEQVIKNIDLDRFCQEADIDTDNCVFFGRP